MVDVASQFQHHVPQFYLRGWATTVAGIPKRVWVYSKKNKPRNSAIRRVGGRNNTYAVAKADGTLDLALVERFLAESESRAGKIFPKILNHQPLSAMEKQVIAVFISVMYRRDLYTLDVFAPEKLAPMIPGLHKEMLEQAHLVAGNPDLHKKYVAAVDRAIELAKENLSSITSQSILHSEPMGRVLASLNWSFVTTATTRFLTSDTPVIFDRFHGIKNLSFGHILFPISSSIMLWMTQWPINPNLYVPIPGEIVATINQAIIRNAFEEVYADHNSEMIDQAVKEHLAKGLPREKAASA